MLYNYFVIDSFIKTSLLLFFHRCLLVCLVRLYLFLSQTPRVSSHSHPCAISANADYLPRAGLNSAIKFTTCMSINYS